MNTSSETVRQPISEVEPPKQKEPPLSRRYHPFEENGNILTTAITKTKYLRMADGSLRRLKE